MLLVVAEFTLLLCTVSDDGRALFHSETLPQYLYRIGQSIALADTLQRPPPLSSPHLICIDIQPLRYSLATLIDN